ncbi:Tetraspanin-11 [Glycine soja]
MTSGWVGNLKAVVILVIVMVWRLKWRSCVLDKFDMVKVLNMGNDCKLDTTLVPLVTHSTSSRALFRISKIVVGALNVLSLLLGIGSAGEPAYIHVHGDSNCQKVLLQVPLLVGGIFVVLVSALGIAGSLCCVNGALYVYLLVMFMVIVGLAFFTVFELFVTNRKMGQQVSNKGYGEYKEDALARAQAAKAVQMRCIAVRTTLSDEALELAGPTLIRDNIGSVLLNDILSGGSVVYSM